MKFYTRHFPTHGAGAILSYQVRFTDTFHVKFWKGGYGNIPAPMGFWSWYPKYTYYRKIALHLTWLNCGISFVFSPYQSKID